MKSNNTTIEKRERSIARPPKVLVPLIKEDLRDGQVASKQAGMPYYIAAGEKLLEAKSQIGAMSWGDWLARNFHLSQTTARDYMRAATESGNGKVFATLSHAKGDARSHHEPGWTGPVKDVLKNLRMENLNLRKHDLSVDKEERLERQLALQLIEIGYKVLVIKLHPDKGGSHDAMQRLNRVRARLKEAA
jgi:hypothetical protein